MLQFLLHSCLSQRPSKQEENKICTCLYATLILYSLPTVASYSGRTGYCHTFWAGIDGVLFLHQNLDLWWNFLCGNAIKIINDKVTGRKKKKILEVLASFLEFWRLKFQIMFSTFGSITVFLQCFPFVASFVTAFSLPSLSFKNYPFTFLLFVSQIMSATIPGQVGGLTALNILHNIFVCSKALMQSLPLLLLQWIFHAVCQWFLWQPPLNFWPWIPSIVHNFESMQVSKLKKLFLPFFSNAFFSLVLLI